MYPELFDKYRDDRLTPDEPEQLRRLVNSLDDPEMEKLLDECGTELPASGTLSDEAVERIHGKCMAKAGIPAPRHTLRWMRPVAWAAAVMIPVLLASTILLFMQNRDYRTMAETGITVATGEGERATAQLPDGSTVELNFMSELSYTPASFNDTGRKVRFSGEGFFTVSRNDAAPFVVDASGLEVTVRGTMFNLHIRQSEQMASLYLDEGCVDLRTDKQAVRLSPGQLANVNRATGDIAVTSIPEPQEYTAWRTGFISFNNRSIGYVIDALSSNYGYKILLDADSADVSGRFTGHIPANNLNEALGILEFAYHLNARIDGRTVILSR